MNVFSYPGSELDLFASVHNWKRYWSSQIQPYIGRDVLEVGAGIGSNTPYLNRRESQNWVCVEPDPLLAEKLASKLGVKDAHGRHEIICGTLKDLGDRQFDTILYIDVLEHIEDDRKEVQDATRLLTVGGRLVVLSPAHQYLYAPFDAAIGHFRRYSRTTLRDITPSGLKLEKIWYLDSVGLLLSLANRHLLQQSVPTESQLSFWDRRIIPISRVLDRCLGGAVGKSVIAVWHRESISGT